MSKAPPVLIWSRTKRPGRPYALTRDGEEIASFELRSMFGTRAVGECGGSRWTLRRVGFFRPKVTVEVEGTDRYVAVVELKWNADRSIHTERGEVFEWKRASVWGSAWACLDRDQIPVLKMKVTYRFLSAPYEVIPVDLEKITSHYPWLLVLSMYLAILDNND
jgi:hypothetical protein